MPGSQRARAVPYLSGWVSLPGAVLSQLPVQGPGQLTPQLLVEVAPHA